MLYQNDDFGKDFLKGFQDGLGDSSGKMIIAQTTYEPTDPQWANDPGVLAYLAWMKAYYPAGNPEDVYNVWGYSQA